MSRQLLVSEALLRLATQCEKTGSKADAERKYVAKDGGQGAIDLSACDDKFIAIKTFILFS